MRWKFHKGRVSLNFVGSIPCIGKEPVCNGTFMRKRFFKIIYRAELENSFLLVVSFGNSCRMDGRMDGRTGG